jgi:hypothetical protein
MFHFKENMVSRVRLGNFCSIAANVLPQIARCQARQRYIS